MSEKLAKLQERKAELLKKKAALQSESKSVSPSNQAKFKSMLNRFRVKSLDELVGIGKDTEGKVTGVNTAESQFSAVPASEKEAVRNLKEAVDLAVMESQYFGTSVKGTYGYGIVQGILQKDFGISPGDQGYEWIPTGVSTSYIDEFNLERKVVSLFREIRMPTNPFKMPVLTNGAIARKVGAKQELSPKQTFDTDSTITFDATKITTQYCLPEELSEDSAVNILQVIRRELLEGMEKSYEIAILNGDTDALHMDSETMVPGDAGAPAANSPERFWDGLRKRGVQAAASQVDAGNNAIELADITAARTKMGKYGVSPRDLALICSPKGHAELLDVSEVVTLEKYGSQATILAGELARIQGIPVIVSEWMREDLNDLGVHDGITTDRTAMLLVNRSRYMFATRRALQIRVERNQTFFDQVDLVAFSRNDFNGVLKADGSNYAEESSLAYIVNIA